MVETLLQMLYGYRVSQLLYVTAKLGLADLLAAGPVRAEELARHTGTHRETLETVLRRLTEIGVLCEVAQGCFALTPMGVSLRSDVVVSLYETVIAAGERDYYTWGELLHQLRTDESAFTRAHGEGWFEYYARTSDGQIYRDMIASARPIAEDFLRVYDLAGIRRVVDVGGGYGAFLVALLRAWPVLTGVVFDLPAVQEEAESYLAASGVADRCTFCAGNFFEAVPAGADTYILLRVLRNWGDGEAIAILKSCRRALPADGRVLVIDPVPTKSHESLSLELEARRFLRTEAELRALFAAADLWVTRVSRLSDWGSVVETVSDNTATE
jgi:hypothetical protein